jgi:hypothetical protein
MLEKRFVLLDENFECTYQGMPGQPVFPGPPGQFMGPPGQQPPGGPMMGPPPGMGMGPPPGSYPGPGIPVGVLVLKEEDMVERFGSPEQKLQHC